MAFGFIQNVKKGAPTRIPATPEIEFYTALNALGRGYMRSASFPPQKIPEVLTYAGRQNHADFCIYLYPLLLENPAKWVGSLARGDDE